MSVLVIAEHDHNSIKSATLHTLKAAFEIGADVDLLVAGFNCQAAAEQAAKIEGVRSVKVIDDAALGHQLVESVTPQVLSLAEGYTHILAPATTTGKNLVPRLAAKLGVNALSDVVAVVASDTFKRPIYAGNAIATVQSDDAVKVMTVRATAFDKVATEGGSASIDAVAAVAVDSASRFVSETLAESDRPELTAARVVVSGGRGLGSGENFGILYSLADKLGGAVGASRAAVDAGFVPNDLQVGQTGKMVAPDLYIAVGISGAIQHLAGMKDSKIVVAINKDEEAPIFQVADYGLVADLFDVIPELERLV